MTRITKKEAVVAGLGTLALAGAYVSLSLLSRSYGGAAAPAEQAGTAGGWFFKSLDALEEFVAQLLPNIAAVLVGTVAAFALIIRKSRKYDVFLSVPMSTVPQEADFARHKAFVGNVEERALRTGKIKSVYNPMKGITQRAGMDLPGVSIEKDLSALDRSAYYVLILPERLASSVIFEAGYAYARRLPALYFVRNKADLPYMMREPQLTDGIHIFEYTDEDDIMRRLAAFDFKL